MKRALQIMIAMSFVALFLVSPVAAATSEGLEWGVELNDEFTYQYKVIEESEILFDEGVNFTVEATPPTISDPLADFIFMGHVDVDFVFTNGSSLGFASVYLLGLILVGGHFAVPIGNFTLLGELYMDSIVWNENTTIVNDASKWGVTTTGYEDDMSMQAHIHYLKADGFISRYTLEARNVTSGVRSSVSLIRDGVGLDIVALLQDNLLYVGIGVILIIGVVVCMRRR